LPNAPVGYGETSGYHFPMSRCQSRRSERMKPLLVSPLLTWQQWLICLFPMLPMIPTALWANQIDPPQAISPGNYV